MPVRELFRSSAIVFSLVLAISLSGCSMFGKPALPRRAEGNSLPDPEVNEFAARIKRADVIYFPVENLDRSAAKLIQALRDEAKPFAIAWQDLSADDQVILDGLSAAKAGDSSVSDQLTWASGQSRESRKGILRVASDLPHLAIGLPRRLRMKLQMGGNLNTEERLMMPEGYRAPADGLENFAEEHAATRDLGEGDIPKLYRIHLTAEQFAAEKIVTYLQQHRDCKMLIFLHRRDFIGIGGVPNFVTQKIKVRQVILDLSHNGTDERPRIFTSTSRWNARGLL